MKQLYSAPKMTIVDLSVSDILTTSTTLFFTDRSGIGDERDINTLIGKTAD